jgi:uncharacterized protein (TIGR00369 family)
MASAVAQDRSQRTPSASWMDDEPVRGGAPDPRLLALSGLEAMRAAWGRRVPAPPIHHLVGLRPVTVGPAAVTFTMPTSPRLCSDAGVFHAGTAALVVDAALAGAVQVTLPPRAMVATSDLSLNFLRPVDVASGQLIARARPIDVGASLGLAEGVIEDSRGRLIAHATTRCFVIGMTAPALAEDLPEPEHLSYGTPDPYQRPAPPPLANTWGNRQFVEVVAAKRRGELPLAPCSELLGCYDPTAQPGAAALSLKATPWLTSPAGAVYGGVLALLADIVLTGAVATTLPSGTICSPLDLKVQFVRPVWPDGRPLRASATVAHRGRRCATAHAEIATEEGKTVALAISSLVVVEGRSWGSLAVADEAPVEHDP